MKLINKQICKDGGRVSLIAEDSEDLWTVYNLISVGDSVRSTTIRKVASESSTGSVVSDKMRITLTIQVEAIDFDALEPMLRLKGRNIVENEHVKLGAYHTLELELNRKFSLAKPGWDSVATELVHTIFFLCTAPPRHESLRPNRLRKLRTQSARPISLP
jgi:protein pelota